jgi:endonuclease III
LRKKDRCIHILDALQIAIPSAETELHYRNPYELLVAVILSAQCTDKRVNMVTPAFFDRFPTPALLQKADFDTVFDLIRSISFPNNKAKHLMGMADRLMTEYAGQVPDTIEALVTLPGVGRKTANVIVSVVYGQAAMAVDTHVFRVSQRLGLAKGTTPLEIEKQLMKLIPADRVPDAHHLLILHGRYTCTARSPKCMDCAVYDLCTWKEKLKKPEASTATESKKISKSQIA